MEYLPESHDKHKQKQNKLSQTRLYWKQKRQNKNKYKNYNKNGKNTSIISDACLQDRVANYAK